MFYIANPSEGQHMSQFDQWFWRLKLIGSMAQEGALLPSLVSGNEDCHGKDRHIQTF